MKEDSEVLNLLTEFCVGNVELDEMEALLGQFNVFEATGLTREEIRHSRFLSFLLSPRESHGIGDRFVTRFLQAAVHGKPLDAINVSALELELMDLADLDVTCEADNIDVLLLSPSHKFAVIVENKVGSGEHSGQLTRYLQFVETKWPGWRILPILLSADGSLPSDSRYFPISYGVVADLLQGLLRSGSVGPEVALSISHYERLIRRHIMTDAQMNELCDQIIAKHRKALNILFERLGDPKAYPRNWVMEWLEDNGFERKRTKLLPKSWVSWMPTNSNGDWLAYFFVQSENTRVSLILEVGREPQVERQLLLDGARRMRELFTVRSKTTEVYTRIWRVDIARVLSPSDWKVDDWQEAAYWGLVGLSQGAFPGIGDALAAFLRTK